MDNFAYLMILGVWHMRDAKSVEQSDKGKIIILDGGYIYFLVA